MLTPSDDIGGIFGDTVGFSTFVSNTKGVYGMNDQYWTKREGGWRTPKGGFHTPNGGRYSALNKQHYSRTPRKRNQFSPFSKKIKSPSGRRFTPRTPRHTSAAARNTAEKPEVKSTRNNWKKTIVTPEEEPPKQTKRKAERDNKG